MTQDPFNQQPYDPYTAPPAMDGSQPPVTGGGYYAQQPGYGQSDPYAQPQYSQPQYGAQHDPYAQPGYAMPQAAAQAPQNGMGTAGLVLGIVSIVIMCIPCVNWVMPITAILAMIFGGLGMSKATKGEANNKGMAMAGLILGGVALLLLIIGIVMVFAFGMLDGYNMYDY